MSLSLLFDRRAKCYINFQVVTVHSQKHFQLPVSCGAEADRLAMPSELPATTRFTHFTQISQMPAPGKIGWILNQLRANRIQLNIAHQVHQVSASTSKALDCPETNARCAPRVD